MARTASKAKAPARTRTPARAAPARAKPGRDAALAASADATLQSRLVEAQATMERDYARLRELEARYRHLFVATSEALVVVDAASLRVLDANPAVCALLGVAAPKLVGGSFLASFDAKAEAPLRALAADLQGGGEAKTLRVETAGGGKVSVTASLLRQDGAFVLVFRLDAIDPRAGRGDRAAPGVSEDWARYCVGAPDGVVLTDLAGRILQANAAFVELVQVATERQVRGESLGRWLGRTSVDLGVLIGNLRQRGALKLFSTHLRAEYGSLTEVEISAALVSLEPESFLGFTIRDVGRRLPGDTQARGDLSKSVGQLTELVGRVPMREIVANTAGLIEKMSIEAALQLTRDNRAAAAELLGLSRQSLYVKLRRYGLGDVGSDDSGAG